MADEGTDSSVIPWKFHWSCGQGITLSEDRRTADGGRKHSNVYGAFSNDPIPNGLQFSVKILETSPHVSPLSASSRPHPSAASYTAGGAVHVVHCCLFFVCITCILCVHACLLATYIHT